MSMEDYFLPGGVRRNCQTARLHRLATLTNPARKSVERSQIEAIFHIREIRALGFDRQLPNCWRCATVLLRTSVA
jgi:hypothetical protein